MTPLACSPENQRRIREADGFAVLLKLLEAGHETPAAQHGAATLKRRNSCSVHNA